MQENKNMESSKVKNNTYVWHPSSTYKMFWDILIMLLIFYEIVYIPFRLSFDDPNGILDGLDV
jgi:hypothetical protein